MDLNRPLRAVDAFQQRHRPLAFGFAVVKKFGDDQGGNLAALITYYAFLSLFPLLLVLITVLGFVLHGHEGLRHDVLNSALADFPIIGDQIKQNVGSVRGSGIGLVVGALGALYGGLGVANAAQDAMNRVWEVPVRERPGFFPRLARGLALIATLGAGVLATTIVSSIGGAAPNVAIGAGALVLSLVLDVLLFAFAFRVLTTEELSWNDVLPGAVVAAIGWTLLQSIGAALVSHQLRGMSQTSGLFAIVIGLLAWIFLQARVVLYAAEINVVRVQRLWPRSLVSPPYTAGDERAFEAETKAAVRA